MRKAILLVALVALTVLAVSPAAATGNGPSSDKESPGNSGAKITANFFEHRSGFCKVAIRSSKDISFVAFDDSKIEGLSGQLLKFKVPEGTEEVTVKSGTTVETFPVPVDCDLFYK